MSAIQVTVSSGLDWAAVGLDAVTLALAAATVYLALQTKQSVKEAARTAGAAKAEADATVDLVKEARIDRELEVQPVIVGETYGPITVAEGQIAPALQVRNIGRGPALTVRVLKNLDGEVFWSEGLFAIPPGGQTFPPYSPANPAQIFPLTGQASPTAVEPSLILAAEDVVVYCRDQLGNGLRFNVRAGKPPELWPRGKAAPRWSAALEEPFDWRPVDQRS